MASKKHTMTAEIVARGRVGDGIGPIHVYILADGTVRADCEANPDFWLKTMLPPRVPGEATIQGKFRRTLLTGTLVVDVDGCARADSLDALEFWLEFQVPEAFMPPCSGNPNVVE